MHFLKIGNKYAASSTIGYAFDLWTLGFSAKPLLLHIIVVTLAL